MGIHYKRRIFWNDKVERFAEDEMGIYIIQKSQEIVFIGESGNLHRYILDRLSDTTGHRIIVSFYSCNTAEFNLSVKASELLQRHKELHGSLPEFNATEIADPCLVN